MSTRTVIAWSLSAVSIIAAGITQSNTILFLAMILFFIFILSSSIDIVEESANDD